MKKLLAFVLLATSIVSTAQEKVVVEYEFYNVFDLSKETNPNMLEIYKNSNENKTYYELITSEEESQFKKIDRIDNSQSKKGMMISFGGPGEDFYKSFKENISLTFMDYNGTKLIIKDTLKVQPWKIQKDKSTYLGYDIKKATYTDKDNLVYTAWYAPKLALKNGPVEYAGLPGLILKLEIVETDERGGENKRIYNATDIKINPKAKITRPTKGKVISEAEFTEMIKEETRKFEEMYMNKV
ncbi:MAG TPA: GLPGLI family protein, partial [Faecalibacter sp.]